MRVHARAPVAVRALVVGLGLLASGPLRPVQAASERRQLRATPRTGDVVIDGRLDEPAWRAATPSAGFTQTYPDAGKAPVQDTEVRVIFDDEALYVALRCLEREPARLDRKLSRRDDSDDTDRVVLYLDSRLDRRSGFFFGVSAAGIQSDGTLYDDTWSSSDWDGVWEAAVAVVADAWHAELRIPWSLLRYQPGDDVRMGLNVGRRHLRHNQNSRWQYEPPGSGRGVSSYGILEGLHLPRAPLALEATPYLALRALHTSGGFDDDVLRLLDTGVDVKLGLLGNLNLVGSVNPDFGQVEADPAVLNLSTIETYYPEKRPFFLEERELWQRPTAVGDEVELFYSRRVGRAARPPDLAGDEELVREAPAQRILGATKLVGRSDQGLTVGALQALTGPSLATVRGPHGVDVHRLAEPAASYTALRLSQSLWDNASAGVMGTALATVDQGAAFAGGADAQFDWQGFRTTALGHLSALTDARQAWHDEFTRAALARDGPLGHGASLNVERVQGEWLVGGVGASYRSPNLALDDVGYMSRGDLVHSRGWLQLRRLKPLGPVVRANLTASASLRTNTAGLPLERSADLLGWLDFSNNWGSYVYLQAAAPGCDDRETRSQGAVAVCEQYPDVMGQVFAITDARASLWAQGWLAAGNSERGGWVHAGGSATLQPVAWLKLELSPSTSQSSGTLRWISTEASVAGDRYLFADTLSREHELTLRGTILASPALSLQLYGQLLHYSVDYRDKLRALPATGGRVYLADLRPARNVDDVYDLSAVHLQLNAVLRWEYRPGSIVWLVYTTSLGQAEARAGRPPPSQVQALRPGDGEHAVMLKLGYRLGS